MRHDAVEPGYFPDTTAYHPIISITHARPSLPEKLFCGYITAIPLLWVLGLTLPTAFLLVFVTFLIFVRQRRALAYALPWFLVGLLQMISVVTNWADTNQSGVMLIKHFLASYVSGWLILGAAIGIGASGLIHPVEFLRSVTRLSLYCVIFAVPAYTLAFLLAEPHLHVLTPIGSLLPSSTLLRMSIFTWDELFGIQFPRISLFSPWATAFGFAGLCLIYVTSNYPNTGRRTIAVASGVFVVIASLSRLALLNLLICVLIHWLLGRSRFFQIVALCAVISGGLCSTIWFGSPKSTFETIVNSIDQIRPGASQARADVYAASWEGLPQAPLLGHGWPGESVYDEERRKKGKMVPGSHSTISGLLYKGGLLTFVTFILAFIHTTAGFLSSLDASALSRNTLTLLCGIAITCIGESLESLVYSSLFAFVWIGIALHAARNTTALAV